MGHHLDSFGILFGLSGSPVENEHYGQYLFFGINFRSGGDHRIVFQRQGFVSVNRPIVRHGESFAASGNAGFSAVEGETDHSGIHFFICHIGIIRHQRPVVPGSNGDRCDFYIIGGIIHDHGIGSGVHFTVPGNHKGHERRDSYGKAEYTIIAHIAIPVTIVVIMIGVFVVDKPAVTVEFSEMLVF